MRRKNDQGHETKTSVKIKMTIWISTIYSSSSNRRFTKLWLCYYCRRLSVGVGPWLGSGFEILKFSGSDRALTPTLPGEMLSRWVSSTLVLSFSQTWTYTRVSHQQTIWWVFKQIVVNRLRIIYFYIFNNYVMLTVIQ